MNSTKIFIEPAVNILYSSYYILGLYEVFGQKNVKFSGKHFKDLDKNEDKKECDSYLPIIIKENGKEYKIIIDFGDNYPIRKYGYQWCDIYAKINYFPEKTEHFYKEKIYAIPPGFGIKIWNIFQCMKYSFVNLIKSKFQPHYTIKKHFRSYFSQIKALPLNKFLHHDKEFVKTNYVFFISSLWSHENCLTGTNLYRKNFVENCKKQRLDFEGGFLVTEKDHPQLDSFKGLTFNERIPLFEFVDKTKDSVFVFNTPSVFNCHGWKLGQYFAMNKAIISTPLQNAISENLQHGQNIHFVNSDAELKEAIESIKNENYRQKLEQGSREFYNKYTSPSAVIENIFKELKDRL